MTPYEYLHDLIRTDRGPSHNEEWMTERLQARWPGNYKVERVVDYQWQWVDYKIVFDSEADETWARLQWTYNK